MAKKVRSLKNKNDLTTRRRRRQKKLVNLYIFATLLFVAGIIALFRWSALRITAVEVVGAHNVSREEIKSLVSKKLEGNIAFIFPRDSALLYPQQEIESLLLSTFPRLSKVTVNAGFNGDLDITVVEKVQTALWCNSSSCYAMDYSGFIFDTTDKMDGLLMFRGLIEGEPVGKHFGDGSFVSSLSNFSQKLKDLGFDIFEINITDMTLGEANTRDGVHIKFIPSEADDPALLEYLTIFIETSKSKNDGTLPQFEYIDARYGNKVFYKTK